MHGIIQQGKLVVVGESYLGAKPVAYEDVPLFDQTTHYVIQRAPVDLGNHIFLGVEIREMTNIDNEEILPCF
jgi:hypothetical protein